jgi:tetratricopeptide (TPR) repeat protein
MQSLEIIRAIKSLDEDLCLSNLAELEYLLGNVERAIERAREAVVCARATPGQRFLGISLMNLAGYLLAWGSPEEARPLAEEGFLRFGELARDSHLQIWAVLAAFEGCLTEAAQLIGFVDAERVRNGQPREPGSQRLYDELMRRLETGLPAADLLARKAEGALWSKTEAVDFTSTRLVAARYSRVN